MGNADIFEFSKCRVGEKSQEKVRANVGKTEEFSLTKRRQPVAQGLTNIEWKPCREEPFINQLSWWGGLRAGVCSVPKELGCYLLKHIINKQADKYTTINDDTGVSN
jgi:hypothetical protein